MKKHHRPISQCCVSENSADKITADDQERFRKMQAEFDEMKERVTTNIADVSERMGIGARRTSGKIV